MRDEIDVDAQVSSAGDGFFLAMDGVWNTGWTLSALVLAPSGRWIWRRLVLLVDHSSTWACISEIWSCS